ncbi:MAG: NAD-dependent isocitrate dehydrogenase [Candidatus Eremiobacteraeota bacterium]|nr:NAD-dependent isocitrate dehydrogenase [Candidatus Eremiobacteraeota bacterium]
MIYKAVCIPGDGIGPEITAATLSILRAAGAPVEFEEHPAGVGALEKGLDVLPESTLKAISRHKVALKGPCTTPVGGGFTSVNVGLRKRLNLFAALRPVRSLKGVPTRFENVDLIVIRENTEGLYSGLEHEVVPGVVASLKVATEAACGRIALWAFRFATHRKRRKITVFHKANIMKLSDGVFRKNAQQVHREDYPNIDLDDMIIDAGCMRLVQDPSRFDILLMENLYGDVVSDLCAGMVGGLGVTPGANYGEHGAVFEAVHGSAPDIAGQGLANPLALLMSAEMMLHYLGDQHEDRSADQVAERIRRAYEGALENGEKTRDLGGELSTDQFAQAVIARL